MKKKFLVLLVLIAALAWSCASDTESADDSEDDSGGGGEAPAETVSLSVGLFGALSDAGNLIAQEKGYFEEEGLEIEFVPFRAAPQIISLLAAGEVDAAGIAPTPGFFNAILDGVNIKLAADKGKIDPDHSWVALVVNQDLFDSGEVTSVADLEGRTVGITGLETSTGGEFAQAMEEAGLSIDDVDLQPGNPADNLTALQNGAIDAAALQEPFVTLSQIQGAGTIIRPFGEVLPNGQNGVLAFGEGMVEDEALSARYLRAYLRGVADYNAAFPTDGSDPVGRDEVVQILVENTPVENPDLYDQMAPVLLSPTGEIDTDSVDLFQQFFIDRGLQDELVPASDYLLDVDVDA